MSTVSIVDTASFIRRSVNRCGELCAYLHFPKQPFALHLLLQDPGGLIDIVVSHEHLHHLLLNFCCELRDQPSCLAITSCSSRRVRRQGYGFQFSVGRTTASSRSRGFTAAGAAAMFVLFNEFPLPAIGGHHQFVLELPVTKQSEGTSLPSATMTTVEPHGSGMSNIWVRAENITISGMDRRASGKGPLRNGSPKLEHKIRELAGSYDWLSNQKRCSIPLG
jgi:hypothetical protein